MTTDTSKKTLGMAWYKFLIYFSLFAGAICGTVYGFMWLTGEIYFVQTNGKITASDVYTYYGNALKFVDVLYGLCLIALAVFSLVLRHKLAKYKADAPKLVYIFYFLSVAVGFMYSVLDSVVTSMPIDSSVILNCIEGIVMLLLNVRYFKRRAHLFTETTSSVGYADQEPTIPLRKNNSETHTTTSRTSLSAKDFGALMAERAHALSTELLEEKIYHKPGVNAAKINSINYFADIFYIALTTALLADAIYPNTQNVVHEAVSQVIVKNDIYIIRYNDFKDIDETIDAVSDDYRNMLERIIVAMKAESPMFTLNGVFRDEVIQDTELFYDLGGIEFIDFISACMEDATIIAKNYRIK